MAKLVRYMRKPEFVEAFRFCENDFSLSGTPDWPTWAKDAWGKNVIKYRGKFDYKGLAMNWVEGFYPFCEGDYIVRESNGDIYALQKHYFENIYKEHTEEDVENETTIDRKIDKY